jgi:hypothetical protein
MATKKKDATNKAEKKATVRRKKHVADVTHKPAPEHSAADTPPVATLDADRVDGPHVVKRADGSKQVRRPKLVTETYEQKVDQIKKDFALLVAKLRSHGIHLDLDPKKDEGEEV